MDIEYVKVLFEGLQTGVRSNYVVLNQKVPMWACWILTIFILVPIGTGIYLMAKLTKTEKLLDQICDEVKKNAEKVLSEKDVE